MPIHLHRGLRADTLADELAAQLATTPGDPMVPDIIAVPTRGVERFLAQRLALHLGATPGATDGVCANVTFPSPREVLESALGTAGRGSPWTQPQLTWAVAAELPPLLLQPEFTAVAHHLAGPRGAPAPGRLFDTANRIAGLLERYDHERPELVAGWASPSVPGSVPPEHLWQVLLWRALVSAHGPAPAMELDAACDQLRAEPGRADLPGTVSLFGPTRLSSRALTILQAIAAHREVHIWLLDPAPMSWANAPKSSGDPTRPRWDSSWVALPANGAGSPLLASLGRDFAELGVRLRERATTDVVHGGGLPVVAGLLGRVQSDIAADRRPTRPGTLPDSTDSSLVLHSCYGADRQVDVVREVVLQLLAGDPTLQPRDILVMTPDLETFGPLFAAAFDFEPGPGGHGSIVALRARIADRTPEQGNQVLVALLAILELLRGRVTIGELLDLAALPAVSQRFRFSEDDLIRAGELAEAAGVRWGLGPDTRSRYQLGWVATGTWTFGLDRLLLGVALSEAELVNFGGTLPLDDVASTDIELLGRLHRLVWVLTQAEAFQAQPHSLAAWTEWLLAVLLDLTATTSGEAWMTTNALAAVQAPLRAAGPVNAGEVILEAADIRSMLGAAVAARPTRSNFRTGGLTLSGMAPMRSVPHRVIILAGMDDGVFPRAAGPDGDDILAAAPRIGERDARSEERQLFLDAVMAAQDHLVITYCGRDERTNEPRPPCVPVGELIDAIKLMVEGTELPQHVLVEHPLQPFDPRNFTTGALVPGVPFSHDTAALQGAIALLGARRQPPAFLAGPLAPIEISELALADLANFLGDPVAGFLRQRLGLPTFGDEEPPDERLPVELSGLANWQIGDRLLSAVLRGVSPDSLAAVEPLRGTLPPGLLGKSELVRLGHEVDELAGSVSRWLCPPATTTRVSLSVSGILLHGAVADCHSPGVIPDVDALVVRSSYSRFKPSAQVQLWVQLLAAAAAQPARRWAAVLQARDRAACMVAPAAPESMRHLKALVAMYAVALQEPLPLPPRSAYHYAVARSHRASPEKAMAAARRQGWQKYGDVRSAAVQLVWRDAADLADLCQEPRVGENHPGESERFAILARNLWDPILEAQGKAMAWAVSE